MFMSKQCTWYSLHTFYLPKVNTANKYMYHIQKQSYANIAMSDKLLA